MLAEICGMPRNPAQMSRPGQRSSAAGSLRPPRLARHRWRRPFVGQSSSWACSRRTPWTRSCMRSPRACASSAIIPASRCLAPVPPSFKRPSPSSTDSKPRSAVAST
eukprot:5726763-Alexandrium_andersonii.AAC.1